ncbi:MAG: NlpC/P60 family protein [Bifidobacterium psychraerophilum]|uniref:NlpC/P60 family protein n=1 Tax=Bifidobacterium psychraerophilum TaxID=218140 RepID=UPI0039EB4B07
MANIQKLIERMRYWCLDVSLGYDQTNRWDIRPGGEADCSSLVIHCLQEAGFDTGAASYTGDMSAALTARGWVRLPNNGSPQAGDILLNDADHVAVYLGGGQLAQASYDENHRASGGASGDQTGHETNVSPYYNFPWNCYLRYTGSQDNNSQPTPDNQGDDDMTNAFFFAYKNSDGSLQGPTKFFDGSRIHPLAHGDEMKAIGMSIKAATGKDVPTYVFPSGPWQTRFEDAIKRANS